MPDDAHDVEIRARLDQLIPDVDVESVWTELTRRFERDRRRRSLPVVAAAAAIAVVLVAAGVGVHASRSAITEVDVATFPAPKDAGQVVTEEQAMPPGAVLAIRCSDEGGTVSPAVVAAGPGGVSVQLEGSSDVLLADPASGGLANLRPSQPGAAPVVVGELVPGSYEVRCGSPGAVAPDDPSIGQVEVVDPSGFYTAPATGGDCTESERRPELYESTVFTVDELVEWRFGTAGAFPGYRDGPRWQRVVDGVAVQAEIIGPGRTMMRFVACPGLRPLPPGDGLAPGDPLRSRTDALAWLDAMGQAPNLAVPEGSTVTGRTAKLVRQDEGSMDAQVTAMAPGYAGWFVRVDYVTAAGVEMVEVYGFSASGDPTTLVRSSANRSNPPDGRPPTGTAWAAWFDDLPDHAS